MAGRNLTKSKRKPSARSKPPFVLKGIDHILLLVEGIKPAARFYTDVLGCKVEANGRNTACCNCEPGRR